ncbi:DUF4087 domain-containing protein [Microcoleus sp. LEGE 07076]|uniref:DUF4087 domain-containing protein n=1 Tax=Microcoleus sp. LEGE 07076 TaxID=915322 RepID=UPI00188106BA|nr:DUF4087 domain-containing protein [Microcoleus sp. LEGE 07076]MBE9185155.1 DUF4087 domain-containing protein [Microcoleus sp. LEGE 07076]
MKIKLLIPALLSFSIVAVPARAGETRCGWLYNPTPANWFLTDKAGSWTISVQGGYQARGMDFLPNIDSRQFVKTNGNYGYGCACLSVTPNRKQMRITEIKSGKALPLSTCQRDRNLPKRP